MLAWIWIYEEGYIKVKFDTLYYYLHVSSPYRSDFPSSMLRWRIIENTCSRRDKSLGQLVETDYRSLDLDEIYRVIFIGAPLSEREVREREYFSVKQRDLVISIFHFNIKFDLIVENYGVGISIWKKLPWRNPHKRIKVGNWLRSSNPVNSGNDSLNYSKLYKDILIPFFDLLWYLKEEGQEDKVVNIINEMGY